MPYPSHLEFVNDIFEFHSAFEEMCSCSPYNSHG